MMDTTVLKGTIISQKTFGVGVAAYYTVKFTPAYNGSRVHKQVRLGDLNPCSPFSDGLPEDLKRKRKAAIPEPELEDEAPDDRLPIQKLCNTLVSWGEAREDERLALTHTKAGKWTVP